MYNNKKIDVIIAARMGSSRFPGKTLSDMSGQPMLLRLIERIKRSVYVDRIIVATTLLPADDDIQEWCNSNNIFCYRGSSDNVLNRIYSAARQFNCETIVEVLGDNPFVHSELIDEAIECFFGDEGTDFVSSLTREYKAYTSKNNFFPVGLRVQVLSFEALARAESEAVSDYNREHSTSYIVGNPDKFNVCFVPAAGKFAGCYLPDYNFAVNTREQFSLICEVFDVLTSANENFSIADIVRHVNTHPNKFDIIKIEN